jgi:hypothetical protein
MNATIDEQYKLAIRPETSPEILSRLASSPVEKIRIAAAENPNTPPHTLRHLARDHSSEVRSCVAQNINTPWSLALDLAMDNDLDVRYSLAENPELAWTILCFLSFDQNPFVSHRAKLTMASLRNDTEKIGEHCILLSPEDLEASSPQKIYETLCSIIRESGRLSKRHALRLRHLILLDGHISKAEQKIVEIALMNELLDDEASKIFADLLA